MAGRAQSSQPTVFERLSKGTPLAPAMNTRNLDSYARFFPGNVSRDYTAGNNFGRLAQALGAFDASFEKTANAVIDRNIAESGAEGIQWGAENPEAVKTVEALRQYTLAHPEFQNKSPLVKRAIEAVALENQALSLKARAVDHYNTSGLRNERDAVKVQSAMAEYVKTEIENTGLKNYGDKLLMAQHFMAPVRRMEAALLDQHNQNVESQNVNLLFEQYSQKFSNLVLGGANILNDGKNVNIPKDRREFDGAAVQVIQALSGELSSLGVRDDQIMGFWKAQLFSGKFTAAQIEKLGQAVTFDRNGEKVALASQPGFSKAVSQLKDEETERVWKIDARNRTRAQWAREDAARNAANWAVQDALAGKTLLESLKARGLENAEAATVQAYQSAFSLGSSVQFTSGYSSPERAADVNALRFSLIRGEAGMADIQTRLQAGQLTAAEAVSFTDIAANNATAEGKLIATTASDVFQTFLAANLNISRAEAGRLANQDVRDMPAAYADGYEKAKADTYGFYAEAEQARKAANKSALDEITIENLKRQYIAKNIKVTTNTVLEKAAEEKINKQPDVMQGIGAQIVHDSLALYMPWMHYPRSASDKAARHAREISSMYQDSLNTFNMLFPAWREMTPSDPDVLESLNKTPDGAYRLDTLTDMLTLGQALLGNAFVAEHKTSLILGRVVPEGSMTRVEQQRAIEERIKRMRELGVK